MTGDWRDWRPAIWLAMLGIAIALIANPPWWGVPFLGAAIGVAIRIHQRRRRAALTTSGKGAKPAKRARKQRS